MGIATFLTAIPTHFWGSGQPWVIAGTDIDCYRLDKTGLEATMKGRPVIAEEMSHILATRDAELELLRQHLDKSALARRQTPQYESILGRICEFWSRCTSCSG